MLKCDFEFSNKEQFKISVHLQMEHQVLAIIGASGSGKSTVLKNIVGLLKPTSGSICFNDQILFDHVQDIHVAMHQRKIACIFQNPLLFPHLNVSQNLKYAEQFIDEADKTFSFNQVVELLELKSLLKRSSHQLSGGEAQRVSIGRALLSSPKLLLLDEPLTGLDERLKDQILPFLKTIQVETSLPMIYVTHHLKEVDFLEADLVRIDHGSICTSELEYFNVLNVK